jgi:hypothetical protein
MPIVVLRQPLEFAEYRIVLATVPLPASPMETMTGFDRPGTTTFSTRIEYR